MFQTTVNKLRQRHSSRLHCHSRLFHGCLGISRAQCNFHAKHRAETCILIQPDIFIRLGIVAAQNEGCGAGTEHAEARIGSEGGVTFFACLIQQPSVSENITLDGHWENEQLVADDHNTLSVAFLPDGTLRPEKAYVSPAQTEDIQVTLREGSYFDFQAACRESRR